MYDFVTLWADSYIYSSKVYGGYILFYCGTWILRTATHYNDGRMYADV